MVTTTHEVRHPLLSEQAMAQHLARREEKKEEAKERAKTLDAPWHNARRDPNNFGRDDLDPQHVALFNGSVGLPPGPFPERTLDTGVVGVLTSQLRRDHAKAQADAAAAGREGKKLITPEELAGMSPEQRAEVIQLALTDPSTTAGAVGYWLSVAPDAPATVAAAMQEAQVPVSVSPGEGDLDEENSEAAKPAAKKPEEKKPAAKREEKA